MALGLFKSFYLGVGTFGFSRFSRLGVGTLCFSSLSCLGVGSLDFGFKSGFQDGAHGFSSEGFLWISVGLGMSEGYSSGVTFHESTYGFDSGLLRGEGSLGFSAGGAYHEGTYGFSSCL